MYRLVGLVAAVAAALALTPTAAADTPVRYGYDWDFSWYMGCGVEVGSARDDVVLFYRDGTMTGAIVYRAGTGVITTDAGRIYNTWTMYTMHYDVASDTFSVTGTNWLVRDADGKLVYTSAGQAVVSYDGSTTFWHTPHFPSPDTAICDVIG